MSNQRSMHLKFILWIGLPIFGLTGAFAVAVSLWLIYSTDQTDQRFLSSGKSAVVKVIDLQPNRYKGQVGWSLVIEIEKSPNVKSTLLLPFPIVCDSLTKNEALAKCGKEIEVEYLPSWSEVRVKSSSDETHLVAYMFFAIGAIFLGFCAYAYVLLNRRVVRL